MLKILFLVIDEQRALLDNLYASIAANCDCDLRRLSADTQRNLKKYFKDNVDISAYDHIMLMLRNKKIMKQVRFLKKLPNLVFLEHDACQNYMKSSKYTGKFSKLYKALPGCMVVTSGYNVTQKLRAEDINCHFVPKGYDQALIQDFKQTRDINAAFVGSTKNSVYKERADFVNNLVVEGHIQAFRTDSGEAYVKALNRIRFFISADINFGEYMIKNFEAMAAGCVVFAFDQGAAENQALGFKDMDNIVLYKSKEELLEKIAQLQCAPSQEASIREAGQQLVGRCFTFEGLGRDIVTTLERSR